MSMVWILLELRMAEVVVTAGSIMWAKIQSDRQHQQNNTQLFASRLPIPMVWNSLPGSRRYYGQLQALVENVFVLSVPVQLAH